MSDSEDKNPPNKISSLGLSNLVVETGTGLLNAIAEHFTAAETPLLSMGTIDELAENMVKTAADDTEEDTSNPLDDTEGYNSRLEMFADQMVKSCGERGKPSQGIPEIIFCIECIHPNHPVNNTLDKGYFSIRGSALERLSVA